MERKAFMSPAPETVPKGDIPRLAVPMTLAPPRIVLWTWAAVKEGFAERMSAERPATWGEENEVPVALTVPLLRLVVRTAAPGATTP